MSKTNIKKLFKKYSLPTYTRVGPTFVRGQGSWLWDKAGKRYLDLFPGWGVSILGHCNKQIAKVIAQQAKKLIHLPNNLYQEEQALLAKEIVNNSYPAKVFLANSGAEAVEGAIKLSRLYGQGKRYEIITMKDSFHGRTFAALSATGQAKYKKPFKPILAGFKEVPFNDFGAFRKKITKKTVGVMLELIQGEGGVNIADTDYIKKLKKYCQKHNLLFIVDEVQTGMARTGEVFCFKNYSITPDVMTLSKGLGAGFPISAIVVKNRLASIIKPGMHASTFGGSPLASKVSLEVFKIIKNKQFLNGVKSKGKYFLDKLYGFKKKFSFIKDVRGLGLMLGMELDIESMPIFFKCLDKGLIINATHGNVLRIMPALNVEKNQINKGLKIIEEVFSSIK